MIINDLDGYYIVFDTKNWNTELDTLIFKPLFTTKRSTSTGEEIGTGLGMWLVKLISEDNDARVILLTPREGFGVQIIFPIKYKR